MLSKKLIITTVSLWTMFMGAAHAAWTPPDSWSKGQVINTPTQEQNQVGWAVNPQWQLLGNSWGVADGVSWATSDNPGIFGHEAVRVGSTVTFKFDMYKTLYGTHRFDAIRAWIDWNHDGFDITGDEIIKDTYEFNPHYIYSDSADAGYWDHHEHKWVSLYYADHTETFYSDPVTFNETGYFDLIARVICSRDLGAEWPTYKTDWSKLTPWPNLPLDAVYGQGEVEKWTVQVVPIPPALLLFGSGLISMGFFRRKFKPSV